MEPPDFERFDVVIVGAGISGIGLACHLRMESPDRSFVILEARNDVGGTWDLFRYPGIRSDTDMYTFGFAFKPWKGEKSIADGESIRTYLQEAVAEYKLGDAIRLGHSVSKAAWSTERASWTVTVERNDGAQEVLSSSFLFVATGYYDYKEGYTPELNGLSNFQGTVVHPQKWPAHLNYSGKRVVVIGSGATAMTLVPAMSEKSLHVTMLQRSPTYVVALPDVDCVARSLYKWLPTRWAYDLVRRRNIRRTLYMYKTSRQYPEQMKQALLQGVRSRLPPDFDVEKHFVPRYNPWDQRLCVISNGDLFKAIREHKASVVTDHIDGFTETGIRLQSGKTLEADIIVTATGLNLITVGDPESFQVWVDDEQVDFSKKWGYQGFAYNDVPNLIVVSGYINASWTLRVDLISQYACRMLNHMRRIQARQCTPRLRASDQDMMELPWVKDFNPGLFLRSMHRFPKQMLYHVINEDMEGPDKWRECYMICLNEHRGNREPWVNSHNYEYDKRHLRQGTLEDGVMQFTNKVTTGKTVPTSLSKNMWCVILLVGAIAAILMHIVHVDATSNGEQHV